MINEITNSVFFGSAITLVTFILGNELKQKFKNDLLNPLLISIITVALILIVFNIDYETYHSSAKYVSYLLTPTTICLALPLYKQLNLLRKNFAAILIGITTGALTSCISIFVLAKLLNLTNEEYVTILPKSITSAIGLPLSQEFGGIGEITVALIAITGIFGNIVAKKLLTVCKIKSSIAKGVAIGTSSHAMGTAKAIELGEIEGAMSGLSIAICGVITVVFMQFFSPLI